MNYTLELDPRKRYLTITTAGEANVEDFRELYLNLSQHPLRSVETHLLFDHRQLDSGDVSSDEVKALASGNPLYRTVSKKVKIATLVETGLGFGISRMWESYAERELRASHRIFRSQEEAVAWLEEDAAIESGD
jgi:hypothetical protein